MLQRDTVSMKYYKKIRTGDLEHPRVRLEIPVTLVRRKNLLGRPGLMSEQDFSGQRWFHEFNTPVPVSSPVTATVVGRLVRLPKKTKKNILVMPREKRFPACTRMTTEERPWIACL